MSSTFLIRDRVKALNEHLRTVLDTGLVEFAEHATKEAAEAADLPAEQAKGIAERLHTISALLRIVVERLDSLSNDLGVPVEMPDQPAPDEAEAEQRTTISGLADVVPEAELQAAKAVRP